MNEHMEAAVKAGAFSINPYPFQGGLAAIGHIHIGHGETWDEAVQREKRSAEYKAHEVITAALPHIRAMIANDLRASADAADVDFIQVGTAHVRRDPYASQHYKEAAQIAEGGGKP